jgi:hypothetical protein
MPVHDRTRVPEDVFLDFRLRWLVGLRMRLNPLLPAGYYAFMVPDAFDPDADPSITVAGRRAVAVLEERTDRRVSAIEVTPWGTKARPNELEGYARRALRQLEEGVNLLVIDLFPQSAQAPRRVADAIWAEISATDAPLPRELPLTATAYSAGPPVMALPKPFRVGDELTSMPLILSTEKFIKAPLEASYMDAVDECPGHFRDLLTAPAEGGSANGA